MKYQYLFASLFLALTIHAQTTVQKSAIFEAEDAGFSPKILHEDANFIYGANVAHNLIRVMVYNKADLTEESRFDVEVRLADYTDYALLNLVWFNGKITAFIKEDNSSATWIGVKAFPVNIETRKLENPVMLYKKKYDRLGERGLFRVECINDKVVVQNATYNEDRDHTEKVLAIYSSDFKELSVYEYAMKLELEDLYTAPAFDKEGNVYFQNNRQLIILPKGDAKMAKEIPLPMIKEDRLISFSYQLASLPNGQIALSAFYQKEDRDEYVYADLNRVSESYEEVATEGLLYYIYDPASQSFVVQRKHKFEQSYVDRFLEDSDIGELPRIPQVFTNIQLHYNEAGDGYLLGERLKYLPIYSTDLMTLGEQIGETFEMEDIILLKLKPNGDLQWKEYVPKIQRYTWVQGGLMAVTSTERELSQKPLGEYDYYSFYARFSDDGLSLIYNDYPENEMGLVSYEDAEVYEDSDEGGPVYIFFDHHTGAAKERAYWEDLVIEDDLYFKTQNMYYSELEKVYYGVLSLDGEYQLIRFEP